MNAAPWILLLMPGAAEAGDRVPELQDVTPPEPGQGVPEAPGTTASLPPPHLPSQGGKGGGRGRDGRAWGRSGVI